MSDRDVKVVWCNSSKTFDIRLGDKLGEGRQGVLLLSLTKGEYGDMKKGIREAVIEYKRAYKAAEHAKMDEKVKGLQAQGGTDDEHYKNCK